MPRGSPRSQGLARRPRGSRFARDGAPGDLIPADRLAATPAPAIPREARRIRPLKRRNVSAGLIQVTGAIIALINGKGVHVHAVVPQGRLAHGISELRPAFAAIGPYLHGAVGADEQAERPIAVVARTVTTCKNICYDRHEGDTHLAHASHPANRAREQSSKETAGESIARRLVERPGRQPGLFHFGRKRALQQGAAPSSS